ncbi:MAG TPA: arsenosugar biosynthesis radical SAM (seleno)protein ArsS [Syntrophorhabdales bacterium]|nr:arsenosugar biosynthesis radical SAM (seleno)protein ArsS [Syntrophorhabdales bacterium]
MLASVVVPSFGEKSGAPLKATSVDILQINLGYRCTLECRHCHVEAGPRRSETMSRDVLEQCLVVLKNNLIPTVDVTGGSPELHPDVCWLLDECGALQRRIIIRSNGVLLCDGEREGLLELCARNRVEIVLSLPHVTPRMTDRQRGEGVFAKVIGAMKRLNALGYGEPGSSLLLDIVHNPTGAYLPGSQASLESLYRQSLRERYGVSFTRLFCITNMPVGRYLDYLVRTDNYNEYMSSLIKAFNVAALERVMCKSTLSVGWDGSLYDCDFNQVLGLTVNHGAPPHISSFDMSLLASRRIVVGDHCYGCTAGSGSSCQGQTA